MRSDTEQPQARKSRKIEFSTGREKIIKKINTTQISAYQKEHNIQKNLITEKEEPDRTILAY